MKRIVAVALVGIMVSTLNVNLFAKPEISISENACVSQNQIEVETDTQEIISENAAGDVTLSPGQTYDIYTKADDIKDIDLDLYLSVPETKYYRIYTQGCYASSPSLKLYGENSWSLEESNKWENSYHDSFEDKPYSLNDKSILYLLEKGKQYHVKFLAEARDMDDNCRLVYEATDYDFIALEHNISYNNVLFDDRSITFSVDKIYVNEPEKLTYDWYHKDYTASDTKRAEDYLGSRAEWIRENCYEKELEIPKIIPNREYFCVIHYYNREEVMAFHTDSKIPLYVYAKPDMQYYQLTPEDVEAKKEITFAISAGSMMVPYPITESDPVSYQWYQCPINEERVPISNATQSTYTFQPTFSCNYVCVVSDLYHQKEVTFGVQIGTKLDAYITGLIYADYVGEKRTICVKLRAYNGKESDLTYQWYKGDEILENEKTNQLTIVLEKGYTDYRCLVKDPYNTLLTAYHAYNLTEPTRNNSTTARFLEEGVTLQVNIYSAGYRDWFKIVPKETTEYLISMKQNEFADGKNVGWILYEAEKLMDETMLAKSSYSYDKIVSLEAGKTYYIMTYVSLPSGGVADLCYTKKASALCKHQYDNGVVTVSPQCDATGTKKYTCKKCGNTYFEEIAALGMRHEAKDWQISKKATCNSEGEEIQVCKNCGKKLNQRVVKKSAHQYGDWKQTKEADALKSGLEEKICYVCGDKQVRELSKLASHASLPAKTAKMQIGQKKVKIKVTNLALHDRITGYRSSNTKVLKVSKSGMLSAQKKTGKATITISFASGMKKSLQITVQKGKVKTSKIAGIPKKVVLSKSEKYSLEPVITPFTTQDKITFTSSNKKVASVSKNGTIKALKKGTTKIIVRSGKKKKEITVKVK